MPKECIIEFYFKRSDLEKLLNSNPSAKGIIVAQHIIPKRQANGGRFNVVTITARPDKKSKKPPTKTKSKLMGAAGDPTDIIDGCPFPPGCTE
jgi:hypothetical protein